MLKNTVIWLTLGVIQWNQHFMVSQRIITLSIQVTMFQVRVVGDCFMRVLLPYPIYPVANWQAKSKAWLVGW